MKDSVDISIVIPVHNEQDNVLELATEIRDVLEKTQMSWECIYVDDASTDETPRVLADLVESWPQFRAVSLDGNFGQSAALAVGFRYARGRLMATLDGDGQNDPADIPMLMKVMEETQVDMVNGIRAARQDTWVRKMSSKVGNGFRNWLTRESVSDTGCAIRVFRRECIEGNPVWKGMHRFLPTLARMKGFKITERPVNHRPRQHGVTKYGIGNRLWVGLADCMAVRWMQNRMTWPKVKSVSPAPGQDAGNNGESP